MADEQNSSDKQKKPNQEEGNPEVPSLSAGGVGRPNKQKSKKDKSRANHPVNPTFKKAGTVRSWVWAKLLWIWEKLLSNASFWTAAATVAIAAATIIYTGYAGKQWDVMRRQLGMLRASEGAFVTIGRKDGVAGEFIFPKDRKDNVGIVIYFQNAGHRPAKFNWGTTIDVSVKSVHHFAPMTRTRNRKDGSTGESGGQTIGGDSLFVADVGEVTQEHAAQLAHNNKLFLISGAYEYCDDIGTYSCRMFQMFYQGAPYNRFSLAVDYECPIFIHQVAKPDPNIEYLSPCKTLGEEQEDQNKSKKAN
jgi:hypothetical protein